jgi:hypothetical protein
MTTQNLRAIALSSLLTSLAALSPFTPAHAGEVNLTCNSSPGTTTTIALNSGDSIAFGNWSVSDAIDVAYAVKTNCQNRGASAAGSATSLTTSSTTAPKYRVNVNSDSAPQKIQVRQETAPVAAPVTANVSTPSAPAPSGSLW